MRSQDDIILKIFLLCKLACQSLHFDLVAETGSSIGPLAWGTDSNEKLHEPDSHS